MVARAAKFQRVEPIRFRLAGSRAQSTDWLLDGIDNNELTAGGIAILPSIDAIQEFKVLTYNYSARMGHARRSDRSGYDEVWHQSLARFVVRILPQYET